MINADWNEKDANPNGVNVDPETGKIIERKTEANEDDR